ncbi:hypothetical protein NC651_013826 [Populus alba x Populus x berolinensis]|nr:hypothetical protein NC651_013826 [Populus alba x Populus x berolinensis]
MLRFMEKRGSGGECQITKRRNLFALGWCRKGMRFGFEVLGFGLLRFELLLSKVVVVWCRVLGFEFLPCLSLMPSSKNRETGSV